MTADLPDWAQWLTWLPEPEKMQILAYMRALRGESEKRLTSARKMAPRFGEIALGGGEFDEWIAGESIAVLLGELNKGYSPLCAAATAKAFARDATKIHNQKRPRDVHWQRHDRGEWARLDRIQQEISRLSAICSRCDAIPAEKNCANCGAPSWAYRPAASASLFAKEASA